MFTACDEYESSTPYYPFRSLLREVCGLPVGADPGVAHRRLVDRVGPNDPGLLPWLPLLGIPLDVAMPDTPQTAGLDEQFRKARVEEVCVRFLAATLPTTTMLVFDDVHLMDDVSADLLRELCAHTAHAPWLVLLTRREVSTGFVPDGDDVVRVRPAPIDAGAALSLVDLGTGETPLPPHQVAAIAERAGGNPLFLRSLVSAARSGGIGELAHRVGAHLLRARAVRARLHRVVVALERRGAQARAWGRARCDLVPQPHPGGHGRERAGRIGAGEAVVEQDLRVPLSDHQVLVRRGHVAGRS